MLFLLKTGPQELFEMFINRLLDYLIVEESVSPWGLNLPDLNKLSDGALKILPLKDFWDTKKKKWRENTYGSFGAQQSLRMKRLFGENNFL